MFHLTLSFLGGFQVRVAGETVANFRSLNVQGILVYLSLQPQQVYSRDVLAALFWPDESDDVARKNVRQALYQLRLVLGDEDGRGRPLFLTTRQTIQFNPECDYYLDVAEFKRTASNKDWQSAASLYTDDLLTGFPCDSLEFENWLYQEREQLHQLALKALYELAELQIAEGHPAAAQNTARRQLRLEPWREPAHRQLMKALFLNGERTAALAQFEICQTVLDEELGVEPDAQTIALAEQIQAGGGMDLMAELLSNQPQELTVRHNLPARLTPFFGREEEQHHLLERISDPEYRMITLVGEGGIGKSRLAQELAWQVRDRFVDGVWYISLAGLSASGDITQVQENVAVTIAQTLGMTLRGQRSPQTQLLDLLHERQLLLILDNFEHLIDGADIVPDLLQHASQLVIICTSREPLNYQAEWVYSLEHLPLPPMPTEVWSLADQVVLPDLNKVATIQLFVERAQRATRNFALTAENQLDVLRLCWLVAGNPLGLELAAASLNQQSILQLIDNLESSLDVLSTRYRDIPARHRTIRAVFDSSWNLLSPVEQTLLAGLSVFRSGFTTAAVQIVTGAKPSQLKILRRKSLVRMVTDERYELHELLRQFAAEKLDEQQRTNVVTAAHSQYFLGIATAQREALVGETPYLAAQQIAGELDNLRQAWQSALEQANYTELLTPMGSLAKFYEIRGLYQEAVRRFGDAVSRLQTFLQNQPHKELLVKVLVHLMTYQAGAHLRLSEYIKTSALIAAALPLAEQIQDQWALSKLAIYQGEVHWRQSHFSAATKSLNQALTIAQAVPLPSLIASATFHLGVVFDYQGQPAQALTLFREALTLWQELGNRRQAGYTLNSFGAAAFRLGQFDEAETAWTEALSISLENRDLQGHSLALNNLSLLASERHEYDVAHSYLLQALKISEISGDQYSHALFLYNAGENAHQAGWPQEAQLYLDDALALWRQIGDKRGASLVLKLFGDIAREHNHISEAISSYKDAMILSREIGNENIAAEVHKLLIELSGEKA